MLLSRQRQEQKYVPTTHNTIPLIPCLVCCNLISFYLIYISFDTMHVLTKRYMCSTFEHQKVQEIGCYCCVVEHFEQINMIFYPTRRPLKQ